MSQAPAPQFADWKVADAQPLEVKERLPYNAPELDAFAREAEQRYGLPPGIVLAVKNAGERTNTWQTSPVGARGVMQFMPKTAAAYPHDWRDPFESIDAGARYLADLVRQYKGNPLAAVAAYNGGTAAGKAVLAGQPPPAAETRGYVERIAQYLDAQQRQQ